MEVKVSVDDFNNAFVSIAFFGLTADLHNVNVFTSMAKTICDLELRNQKVMKALDACKDQNTVADFERVRV